MNKSNSRIAAVGLLFALVAAGCGSEADVAGTERSAEAAAATVIVPVGTSVVATLDERITTETARTGGAFSATTTGPIVVDDRTIFATGTRINGVLRDVEASGRTSGRARMTLVYREIIGDTGKAQAIATQPLILEAESGTGTDVERIAAGTVLGALVGGIAGGGKGAAVGAGAGAGAGVVVMLATQGDELVLEAGQKLSVRLISPVNARMAARN